MSRRQSTGAVFKRGDVYWLQTTIRGERFRVSLKTSNWNEAQAAAKREIAKAEAGKIDVRSTPFAKRTFVAACDVYIEERAVRVSARTIRTEREHWKHLRAFFKDKPVFRIDEDDVREYLRTRKAAGAANRTINMETGILRRIIVRAGRLHAFAGSDVFKPLTERKDIGRALSHAERLRLLELARSRPSWQNAYLAAVIALNTTMRPGEIRRLQWRDVDFLDRSLVGQRVEDGRGRANDPAQR